MQRDNLRLGAFGLVLALWWTYGLSACGEAPSDLVSPECTIAPGRLAEAKQALIRAKGESCPAPCDADYVLTELAKLPAYGRCGTITLAGNTASEGPAPGRTIASSGTSVATFLFETSGSMNGYLAQQRGMKDHVLDFIQRVRSPQAPLVDTLRLGYIGQRVTSFDGEAMDFGQTLVANKLPKNAGSTSDIADLVQQAFAKTDARSAVVFVSDMVFSPAKTVDPNAYLTKQEILIRNAVEQRLAADPDFSVALLRAESSFKGTYYCVNDKEVKLDGDRPYFMFLAGPRKLVVALVKTATKVTGGTAVSFFGVASELSFELQPADPTSKYGQYQLPQKQSSPPSLSSPEGATAGQTKGQLVVPIFVDLSPLADPQAAAEQLASDKRFEFAGLKPLTRPSPEGYTHELRIRRDGTQYTGATVIELARPTSAAVLDVYFIDTNPCTAAELGDRTYGLQQLVNGLGFAYRNFAGQPAATLTFSINK